MSRENYSYKRRQVFVKKRFQAAFILKFCLLVLLGAGISTGLLFLLSKGTLTTTFEHSRIVIRDTGISILPAVILTNLITLCIVTAATIFVVLFISHKIAGPLFRFEKELDRIAAGDLTTTIRIRKKDQMAEMAARLNLVTESLHEKVANIRDDIRALAKAASELAPDRALCERIDRLEQKIASHFIL
ncbi:MAG: methyl-accepting chemotaxis protein [Deltaproteobacteria bacterium]|nr:methyl-accepting chemotaxis protein [Deltaproteobacteria bacterium]MBW1950281.1 methyl-accepting chemotaxis protein [Deltaproteobacteria bacterium]MBW2009008.1 methyl-accepting chemotaxis protein [Deltaproteobacteria bacterium]MBW2103381.1 methyl-accepting chemotaxis protein [Deltaproteobacteria bacterium]MBW2347832.1 methyl-accepting chemotaxis protein [Deltaproteobacteria bacterium]